MFFKHDLMPKPPVPHVFMSGEVLFKSGVMRNKNVGEVVLQLQRFLLPADRKPLGLHASVLGDDSIKDKIPFDSHGGILSEDPVEKVSFPITVSFATDVTDSEAEVFLKKLLELGITHEVEGCSSYYSLECKDFDLPTAVQGFAQTQWFNYVKIKEITGLRHFSSSMA